MADEYYNNKIVTADGDVLMDLTQDTATPETVLEGETFHLRSGAPATGTYRPSDEIEARLRATVGHSNKNLLDITKYTANKNVSNIQINETTGSLSYTGTGTHVSVNFYAADLGVEMYGKTYTVSCINNLASTADGRLAIRKANTNQIVTRVGFGSTGKKSITFTPDVETFPKGWYIGVMATGSTSTTGDIDISNFMLREASIADDTFEPYVMPTDEAKQDKPVMLYDAGESSVGVHSVTGLSNLTQYSELHITLFAPLSGDDPSIGYTHTIVYPFIFPDNSYKQITSFDCRVTVVESGTVKYKQMGLAVTAIDTAVGIRGEVAESGDFIELPSNHYIYIKRIVGIP